MRVLHVYVNVQIYDYIRQKRIRNIYRVLCMESRMNVEHTETFKRYSCRSKCKVHSRIQVQVPPKCCKNFRKCGILLSAHFIVFFPSFLFSFTSFPFNFSFFEMVTWQRDVISSTSHSPVRKGRVNDNNESQKWTYTGAFLCESSYHTRGHVSEE